MFKSKGNRQPEHRKKTESKSTGTKRSDGLSQTNEEITAIGKRTANDFAEAACDLETANVSKLEEISTDVVNLPFDVQCKGPRVCGEVTIKFKWKNILDTGVTGARISAFILWQR